MATRSDLRMMMLSSRLDETLAALAHAGHPGAAAQGRGARPAPSIGHCHGGPCSTSTSWCLPDHGFPARAVALATGWVTGPLERLTEFYAGHYHLPPLHDARGAPSISNCTRRCLRGSPVFLAAADLWDRSVPLGAGPARVPSAEDLLLHLALHYSWSHAARFGSWRTFRDVRTLAESGSLDWDDLPPWLARVGEGRRLLDPSLCPPPDRRARSRENRSGAATGGFPCGDPLLERHLAGQWFPAEAPCPSRWLDRFLWKYAMRPMAVDEGVSPWARDQVFQRGLAPARRANSAEGRAASGKPGWLSPLFPPSGAGSRH